MGNYVFLCVIMFMVNVQLSKQPVSRVRLCDVNKTMKYQKEGYEII